MAYRLFKNDPTDPPRRETSFDELNDKGFWCALGEDKERAFVEVMGRIPRQPYTAVIHPAKQSNAYHPDLLVSDGRRQFTGEVKTKNSPLFFGRRYGVDPQFAFTMDLKDSFHYTRWLSRGTDILVFIWVKWEAHEMVTSYQGKERKYTVKPMKGIWAAPFSKLRRKELSNSPPEIHWYKEHFRKPPKFAPGDSDPDTALWCEQLSAFEPRLKSEDGSIYNITSKGFMRSGDGLYPAGHSSGSHVFDLSDVGVFTPLYHEMK
jgi:hypothetical protein